MKINPKQIRIDGGTQPRNQIDDSVVDEYAEAMRSGAEFPPVVVFYDGVDHWLADGFHRVHAARRVDIAELSAERKEGTKRDAVLYSVGANSDHGLRRTNADKRKAVMTLLQDEEWSAWPQTKIAEICAVSQQLVSKLASESKSLSYHNSKTKKVERKGKEFDMNTSKIGKREQQESVPDEPEEPELSQRPKSRGVGLRYAHEAIAALKRIPAGDGLRQDALNTVIDWIETNRGS